MLMDYIISGAQRGFIYALVALGIVLIYRTSRILNFAHGDISTFGAFIFYTVSIYTSQWNPYYSFLIGIFSGMLASAVIGTVFYFGVLHPSQERQVNILGQIVLTIGFGLFIQGFELLIWGAQTKTVNFPFSDWKLYNIFGFKISQMGIVIIGSCLLIMLILYILIQRTRFGLSIRAVSQNLEMAKVLSIPTKLVLSLGWGCASAFGSFAGILLIPSVFLDPYFMLDPFLKGFAAAVLGGLDSPPGAIIGGLVIGITENLFGGYVSLKFKGSFAFFIIMLVLIVRPEGLLGKEVKERA